MTTLDWALRYIERGWSVIPLAPGSKTPPAGFDLASYLRGERRMNRTSVKSFWGDDHGMGIGIITGPPSGLVVADVDPRNGGVDPWIGDVPRVETGGGGAHYYFSSPPPSSPPCGPSARPGIDRKGGGGYVVAPPSLHPCGAMYFWSQWPDHALPVGPPDWLLESPARPEGDGERWIADTLANPEGVLPGMRDDALTRLAWWAAGHLDEDIALALLTRWAEALPRAYPGEPFHLEKVKDKLERAYQKREPDPGRAGRVVGVNQEREPRRRPLRELVRAAARFTEEVEAAGDLDWLLPDFVAPGCWTEIVGVMKEGKSTLCCGVVDALLRGEDFLGRKGRASSVLYVSEQVGLSFLATLRRGGLERAENLHILTVADTFGAPWSETGPELVELATELGCGVIVIDTFHRIAGIEDENDSASVHALDCFVEARAKNIAVVFLRHGRKSGGDINVAGRGTGAITGEMDICLLIQAKLGVSSEYRHLAGASRLTDSLDLHLRYEGGTYVLGPTPDQLKKEEVVAPTVAALSAALPGGLTVKEIEEATELGEKAIRAHLKLLSQKGKVRKAPGEQGSVWTLAPPEVK